MAGDYTKFTFKRERRYASVLMQQGRVQLDSDWNEQADIHHRRLRTQALDTYGPAWVPKETTPDAFKLTAVAGPPVDFLIGSGRMYVEGLCAEAFASEAPSYLSQRFYPAPPALPSSGSAIAYLDVWEREVTYIEDADLLEKALGGPDTATRRQLVWQVKIHEMAAPECDVDFTTLFPPSAGQLSTQAIAPPASDNPCILSPAGGYRGLENRLYRVEVHGAGGIGAAKFKWSRENASIVSSVTGMASSGTQTTLTVTRIGRDQVLRLKKDDWVEVTDDHRELMGEAGAMAKVDKVDEAALAITLDRVIPAGGTRTFGANADELKARHTRVKRWDQNATLNTLDAEGLMTVGAAQVELEEGVRVTFTLNPSGGTLHAGDYWVFHARSADGSVDELSVEPPRGIHHHYASLAVITDFSGATQPQDCRHLAPECCGGCCTVNVEPGEDIQAAIDSLSEEGGCVCLKTGEHRIDATIRIDRSRVVLIGESPGARVVGADLAALLEVGSAKGGSVSDVEIEAIGFEVERPLEGGTFIAYLHNCQRIALRRCRLEFSQDALMPVGGVLVSNGTDVMIEENRLDRLYYGIWVSEYRGRLTLTANTLGGLVYKLKDIEQFPIGLIGINLETDVAGMCRIEGNRIHNFWNGVVIGHGASGTVVTRNRIERGFSELEGAGDWLYGIEVRARDCRLSGNYLDLGSGYWGGIQAIAPHTAITGNTLEAPVRQQAARMPIGIRCGVVEQRAGDHALIYDNVLIGPQYAIVLAGVGGAQVRRNHVEGTRDRLTSGLLVNDCDDTLAAENTLRNVAIGALLADGQDNAVRDNQLVETGIAIGFNEERDIEISANHIADARIGGILGLGLRGGADLSRNRLENCGYQSLPVGIGVSSLEVFAVVESSIRIDSCDVIDAGVSPDGSQVAAGPAYGIVAWVPACHVSDNRITYTRVDRLAADREHRALLLFGPIAYRVATGPALIEIAFGSAHITDNIFTGRGRMHLVELQRVVITDQLDLRFEKVTFGNNVCDHRDATASDSGATVRLWGGHLIATTNHVKGGAGVNAMHLSNRNKVALVGNVTTGGYVGASPSVLPSPINAFNVQI